MEKISNFDLKVQLTNEYLRTGGTEKIFDTDLLQDLIDFDLYNPKTFTSRIKAFMNIILASQMRPPHFSEGFISEYDSFLQKSYCFDQQKIDTVEEFDKVYDELKLKSDLLFRGQREAKWRLYSNLQRVWLLNKLHENEDSYESFLEKLIENGTNDFEKKIKEVLKDHNIDSINCISVLGFLQHHGCPTPLLDWTYKFQNALFFGLDGLTENEGPREIEDYFSIYSIHEESLESGGMRKVMDESLETLDKEFLLDAIAKIAKDEKQRIEMEEHFKERKFFDKNRIPGSGMISSIFKIKNMLNFPLSFFSDKDATTGFIFSLNNSKNILNQAGVFTWNASPFKPVEVIGNEQFLEDEPDSNPNDYRFCNCYNINKALSRHILKRLAEDGITKEYIYPTKDINTWDIFEKSKNAPSANRR